MLNPESIAYRPTPVAGAAPGMGLPPFSRFRFSLEALDPIRLPAYAGSAWRGLLGHGLRRTACVTRQPSCVGCLLIHGCVYSTLFETPPPPDRAKAGYSALPHPFVLDIDPAAPRDLEPGAGFDLTITLIGPAIAQTPYLIHALASAGERGIGHAQGRFRLTAVEREDAPGSEHWAGVYTAEAGTYHQRETARPDPPATPEAARVRLRTPLRIKHGGHFIGARDLTAADFIRALYQRLRRLADLYGGDPNGFDARQLAADADPLILRSARLRWHEWTRFSSRQDTLMQMGGLLGEMELSGPGLARIWPALWAGQWLHVGKGTAFGLGGYRLDPLD